MKLVKTLLISALCVWLVSPDLFAQNETIFEMVNIEVLNLNEEQKDKVDKLNTNDKILKYQGVKIKNLVNIIKSSNRKLLIPIPDAGVKQLTATGIKYVDKDNYSWQGNFDDHTGFALIICNESKVSGFISFENRIFELKQFAKNKHILQEYDMELMSQSLDTGIPPPIENPDDPPPGFEEDMVVVRLLILYTPAAANADNDIIQTAVSARTLLNSALAESIPDMDIYVQHVGTELLSFTEQKFQIVTDKDLLISNSTANSLRASYQADIVVLLTNGDYEIWNGTGYSDVYGIAGSIGISNNNAYAIVEHDAASASYTLAHEVGHLLGGHHQNDPSPSFAKGYAFTQGTWPNNNKATLMHTMDPSKTRVLNFSNPDVDYGTVPTGIVNTYDVAREIENNIYVIANYYPNLDDLNASISGPANGNIYTSYTWQANVTGGIAPYSYFWEYSINGIDFIGSLGTTQSITTTFPYNGDFTLRVRVLSADYQVDYGFLNVTKDNYGPVNGSVTDSNSKLMITSDEIENNSNFLNKGIEDLKIYPNPITQASKISCTLNRPTHIKILVKDVSGRTVIEVYNGNCDPGNQSYDLQIAYIKPGIYFVVLESGNSSSYKKITILEQ